MMKKTSMLLFGVLSLSMLVCGCGQNAQNSIESGTGADEITGSLSSETKVMKEVVSTGDLVVVDYVGKHLDGTVFDTSVKSVAEEAGLFNPNRDYDAGLEFTAGAGQMIKGFDEAVIGMKVGESKTVEIPAEKAYGERSEDYVIHVPVEEAGDLSGAEVGMQVILGGAYPAKIIELNDKEVVFDANHELAGKDLVFDITVKSIE